MFVKYPKVHALYKEECDGILEQQVIVQEKIDGANVSIWLDNGVVKCGSRTRELPEDESFNGFTEWVANSLEVKKYLEAFPEHRLYGEWLVPHTIKYNETNYKTFWLFDIATAFEINEDSDDRNRIEWMPQEIVESTANEGGFNYPQIFYTGMANKEKLEEFVGTSNIGDKGEGVVIKPLRLDWRNKFTNFCYGKVVTQEFKEDNATVFGGNNKHSDTYEEQFFVNKLVTIAGVKKVMNKLTAELDEGRRLDKSATPRVANTVYHDIITENAWEISKAMAKKRRPFMFLGFPEA